MSRINTNVPSLIAQNRLQRSNGDLQQSLTRLSTGLRINSGSDDPAGLIASEALRAEITSINKAVSNTRRAGQIIATADSALGQVSNLLNDIRGLVVEAANSGALSDDEIAANQLQIDSSLEAINRIAQSTTFQGRKLIDGSLDFISNVNTVGNVTDSQIHQANLGTAGSVSLDVNISAAATQAVLSNSGLTQANATADLTFAASGSIDNAGESIRVRSDNPELNDVTIEFLDDNALGGGAPVASFDASTNTITVRGDGAAVASADIVAAINDLDDFTAQEIAATTFDFDGDYAAATDVGTISRDTLSLEAAAVGADFNNVSIVFADNGGGAAAAAYDAETNTLTISVDQSGEIELADVIAAIGAEGTFTATTSGDGSGFIGGAADFAVTGDTGYSGGEALLDDLVMEISGATGTEVFNFQAGTSAEHIVAAINLVSDATGVTASQENGTLSLQSSGYGSKGLVNVNVISEGENGNFGDSLSATRATGTNIDASINGIRANGEGNSFSINTSTLNMNLTVADGSDADFSFQISGGGAKFQLGPNVVSAQQARLGISSVNTARLGGVSGRLYELGSGQAKSLTEDAAGGAKIVDEVINKVTSMRGRLGAFQRTTLDSNMISLNDTLATLQEAESTIRDADFAAESARLTRAQILVQSGSTVLAMANQNPQNVLALLR